MALVKIANILVIFTVSLATPAKGVISVTLVRVAILSAADVKVIVKVVIVVIPARYVPHVIHVTLARAVIIAMIVSNVLRYVNIAMLV